MYCSKCGEKNDDNAFKCVRCGEVMPHEELRATPMAKGIVNNYLVWAILATIFCCLPLGIVAIVYSAQVNGRLEAGNYQKAVELSRKAKKWCWVSFIAGVSWIVIYIVIMVVFGVTTEP